MRTGLRNATVTLLAMVGVLVLLASPAWAATPVLVVPGTGTKDPSSSPNYEQNAIDYYVEPSDACTDCTAIPVPYTAEFFPFPFAGWGGLEGAKWNDSVADGVSSLDSVYSATHVAGDPLVIFGYSQGATVASYYKEQLAADGGVPDGTSFVLIANPNRPNGGLFERLAALGTVPILDATFGRSTPTDTSGTVNTTDVAFQYDGVADFPTYPGNLLATANAIAGFWYIHGEYLAPRGTDTPDQTPYGYTPAEVSAAVEAASASCTAATYCRVEGDTRYITLPARTLPIMQPLLDLGTSTGTSAAIVPIVDLLSPVARVLIETGYDRSSYSTPTPAQALPAVDPIALGVGLAGATVQGVTDAASDLGVGPRSAGSTTPAADGGPAQSVTAAGAATARGAQQAGSAGPTAGTSAASAGTSNATTEASTTKASGTAAARTAAAVSAGASEESGTAKDAGAQAAKDAVGSAAGTAGSIGSAVRNAVNDAVGATTGHGETTTGSNTAGSDTSGSHSPSGSDGASGAEGGSTRTDATAH
ncbi:PE-PPE domain-containing protein [Tsukamurella sp. 8F]|uniref:PE-PPE domain-containing protein n=1 Tax=unclassified Tsukamurella TaxID=2633480 RepID=UPI0023B8CED4|nr:MULTISPECIES: PE-PPE domain-containing protein [unclassified Tsukamurella]MDF0530479.1 PE-PPE domain-containing protein [Tsukamurella sp. 8J]MDF0587700.1 PE-PPE domain-containing protein [Tsukamurella sp. 8F]